MKSFLGVLVVALCFQSLLCNPTAKMLGGIEIPIEQIPYQGSVEAIGIHRCSAAILSSKYALITAVCSEGFSADVGIATLRFGTTSRNYDGERYRSTGLTQHPRFDKYNNTFEQKDYDVALVEIYPELEMDNVTIRPIVIGEAPAVGTRAQLSGWGSIEDGGAIMVYARATNVVVTDLSACRTAYQNVFPVTDRMLCAGDNNSAGVTCDGDHGSLLTVNGTVVGLTSWGYGCGRTGMPDVYVNLNNPEVRDFIRTVTGL